MTQPPNPWGSCFDSAAHNLIANRDVDGLRMVHGIGIANRPGQEGLRVAHAWLEFPHEKVGKVAFDPIWLKFVPADLYRKNLQVQYSVEYTRWDFMDLWHKHEFPGPWDEKIKKYTSEGRANAGECMCGEPFCAECTLRIGKIPSAHP
jgi:hypothetical protein